MKARGVDVILCPAYFGAGEIQGQARYWNYTAVWNILDQPAVTFPSGLCVDKEVDIIDPTVSARELFHGYELSSRKPGRAKPLEIF
jgi:amidase